MGVDSSAQAQGVWFIPFIREHPSNAMTRESIEERREVIK